MLKILKYIKIYIYWILTIELFSLHFGHEFIPKFHGGINIISDLLLKICNTFKNTFVLKNLIWIYV